MGTSAELHGVAVECPGHTADLHHTYYFTVFVAKELLDVFAVFNVCVWYFLPADRLARFNAGVDFVFDGIDLLGCQGA